MSEQWKVTGPDGRGRMSVRSHHNRIVAESLNPKDAERIVADHNRAAHTAPSDTVKVADLEEQVARLNHLAIQFGAMLTRVAATLEHTSLYGFGDRGLMTMLQALARDARATLDRQDLAEARAALAGRAGGGEVERLRAFVRRIIDQKVPEGDEAAALNAIKWAAPLALRADAVLAAPAEVVE